MHDVEMDINYTYLVVNQLINIISLATESHLYGMRLLSEK